MTDIVKHLHPSAFAMVMGTGIVSIAFNGLGYEGIAQGLFAVNLVAYLLLLLTFGLRVLFFRNAFLADFRHPERGWGFLTFVVGTNTLGSQLFLFQDSLLVIEGGIDPILTAKGLWGLGLVSWAVFLYLICARLVTHNHGPIENTVNGATLLVVVSTQSVAVLGSQLAGAFGTFSDVMMLVALTHFAAGWVLYLIVITLVTYRLLLRPLEPKDWTGPYWICMGAAAITTLAGANMLLHLDVGDLYEAILVVTYLAWATGVWWIPIQLYLDVWKFTRLNLSGRRPLWISLFPWLRLAFGRGPHYHYESPSWGRVFPMGMFTACTIALTQVGNFKILFVIPSVWSWLALLIWGLTFLGMLRSVGQAITSQP
ncbi:MAG: tellurite resistance/C4-dicarboxylate transporter family protein [Salinibacter sp.]